MKSIFRAQFVGYCVGLGMPPSVTILIGSDRVTLPGEPWILEALRINRLLRVTIEPWPADTSQTQ